MSRPAARRSGSRGGRQLLGARLPGGDAHGPGGGGEGEMAAPGKSAYGLLLPAVRISATGGAGAGIDAQ
jgi:hypothetical protein